MIGIVVACLVLVVVITVMRHTGGGTGTLSGIPDDVMIWVKCMNPKCNAEYETSKKAYFRYLSGQEGDVPEGAIQMARCEQCGKDSLIKAIKCEKCGKVFIEGVVQGDFFDRCPECNYSKIEELRKKARSRSR